MATVDPLILEYLQKTGRLPELPPGTEEVDPGTDLSPTAIDLRGLIAAQNADAEQRRLGALGAAGERAAAAISQRSPNFQPFKPTNDAVRDYVLRNKIMSQAREDKLNRAKIARQAEIEKAKMDLQLRREESEKALREARIADLQLKPELVDKRLAAEAERQKSLDAYRQGQLKLGAERNQIARNRPVGGFASGGKSDDIDAYVDGVEAGLLPPPTGRLTGNMLVAQSRLAKRGFNVSKALMQWNAEKKFLSSLNAPQPTQLRQASHMVLKSLDEIEQLYSEWERVGLASRFPTLNRKAIKTAIEAGGEVGAAAQSLDTMINDLILEQAKVITGGYAPTNEAIRKAEHNLDAAWGGKAFKAALKIVRFNTNVRLSVMNDAMSNVGGGNREANPYAVTSEGSGEDTVVVKWKGKRKIIPKSKLEQALKAGAIQE